MHKYPERIAKSYAFLSTGEKFVYCSRLRCKSGRHYLKQVDGDWCYPDYIVVISMMDGDTRYITCSDKCAVSFLAQYTRKHAETTT